MGDDFGLPLAAAVPSLLCYPPSNYFSIAARVSPSQLASIDYTRVVDVSPAYNLDLLSHLLVPMVKTLFRDNRLRN